MDSLLKTPSLSLFSDGYGRSILQFSDRSSANAVGFNDALQLAGVVRAKTPSKRSPLENFLLETRSGILVVLSESPDIFVSGGHLKELAQASRAAALSYARHMRHFCKALGELSVPSVTLLSGPAFGGGAELALATDFRFALASKAALNLWQSKWGVPGGWNGMRRLEMLAPQLSARKVSLLFAMAASLQLPQLLNLGLVDDDFSTLPSPNDEATTRTREMSRCYLECDETLRHAFLKRSKKSTFQADEQFFERFWKTGEHERRLQNYLKGKKQ